MSAKSTPDTVIKLGQRPITFAPFPVRFISPSTGKEMVIPAVVYKYRTRKEYSAWAESLAETSEYKPAEGEAFSIVKFYDGIDKSNNDALMDCLEGWGLDIELSKDSIAQLQDEIPAATAALWVAYAAAARDGRLGN